ncbi:MAG: hypothetical protein ABIS45_05005 [Burkholderiales bacterium]
MQRSLLLAVILSVTGIVAPPALAQETNQVRIVQQFGLSYLPLHRAVVQKLIEKQARAAGLGEPERKYG